MSIFSNDIKQFARELGFDKVGISAIDPITGSSEQLAEWLNRGFHGTMKWISRNAGKRGDPTKILPGARSVISVGMNYYTPSHHDADPDKGKVSRYAWGDDYHDILGERLEQLLGFVVKRDPSAKGLVYVDTGPVLEKVWAQRSGIGWIGKHTNLITPDLGSWLFLGEIICTLDLEPDRPETDHCGSCTLCIEACPTSAIVEPYVLDARRCISYLTIEHRGDLPEELADQLDGWLYGCDVCQDVCPWNMKFSRPATVEGFEARPGNVSPDPASIAEMTLEEFNRRFARSPVKRTKHYGLVRNAKYLLNTMNDKKKDQNDRHHGQS